MINGRAENLSPTRSEHHRAIPGRNIDGRTNATVATGALGAGAADQRSTGACGKARSVTARLGTDLDIDGVVKIGKPVWENNHSDPWNEAQIRKACYALIHDESGALFVLESDGEISGAIGVMATQTPCGGVSIASELFWFVSDAGNSHGLSLLHMAERWAYERGVSRFKVNAPSFGVASLLSRHGYRPAETIYQKAF